MKSQKKRLKIKGPFSPKHLYQFKKAVLSFRNVVSFDDQVVQSFARDRTRSFEKKVKKNNCHHPDREEKKVKQLYFLSRLYSFQIKKL